MKIDEIFTILHKLNPNPLTELYYTNNFTLLVAIILSAQSTDIGVNKATKELFSKYDTPKDILNLGELGLKDYIKTIGLFNTKAKNIINLCKILVANDLPISENFDDLIKLPGVGRKTANVYLNNYYGLGTIGVDTHVARTSQRLGLSNSKSINKIEADLQKIIPTKWLKNAHNWLVLHGRYICKAKKPLCNTCPINALCEFYKDML
jgi:endonuclease-3